MNITVEKYPKCKAAIRVEVPREKVELKRADITKLFHRSVVLPGFRPGKAPTAMVVRKFGREIDRELRQQLMRDGYKEGRSQEGLEVLGPTDVKDPHFNDDGSFSFTVEVIIAPAFDLPDLKGIPVKLPKVEVTDKIIDEAIQNMRERAAEYPEVEGRSVEAGDVTVINYQAFCDGQPIREVAPNAAESLQAGADYWIKVEEPNFLPGFCSGIVGMAVGETRVVPVTIPEDFVIEELAGKVVNYEITLSSLRSQVLPELDDNFAQETGLSDDVVQLREAVRNKLQEDWDHQMERSKREQVVNYLNKVIDFDLPAEILEQATRQRVQELVTANQERGVSEETIIESQDEILEAANQKAQFDVKTSFILQKIAAQENLVATKAEVEREVMLQAIRARASRAHVRKILKNPDILDRMRENVVNRKTIDFLVGGADIEEIPPTSTDQEV